MPDTLINATDEELMLRYSAGDLPSFRELYRRHSQGLYRFVAWRAPRRAWVDEIVQDAWASLHAARAGYRPQAAFRTYLYQIARNRLIDILRQREGQAQDGEAPGELASEGASPQQSLEQKQQHALLHAAIAALPAEQKEALVLQQFSGMSILDIAVVTGAEAETVKSRLRYAMQKLRAGLDSAAGAGGQA
ncbi:MULTISPECIES: sigma-70 family RNA polymerase sigma factor [unclassified Janthinobacterium]|uniref:sigma-70 family RNA polymerase sigma factor n=1 Tax=unclassified Janthinobacterium TaxID=2610881 RepID=UPI0008F4E3E5|nr:MULTISPECIES: sigma-70 family RNA polymerase sigma factor [unclassified Janthinobacterium]MDN2708015.1 sigma-70 family RNA polymerase sigma factor [Janthinobacterium sp. SUN118]